MSFSKGSNKVTIPLSGKVGNVSALIIEPDKVRAMMALAHGAGAGMTHHFMESLANALAEFSIGTLRFNFPYMEQGKKRPDPPAIAESTVRAVLARIQQLYPALPVLAAGKSFGGRMTSQYLSREHVSFVNGIIFYGFPLHAAGQPSTDRAAHLKDIRIPMLFLQGTRDALAEIRLMENVCAGLPGATLYKIEGADHSFKAGKQNMVPTIAGLSNEWINKVLKI